MAVRHRQRVSEADRFAGGEEIEVEIAGAVGPGDTARGGQVAGAHLKSGLQGSLEVGLKHATTPNSTAVQAVAHGNNIGAIDVIEAKVAGRVQALGAAIHGLSEARIRGGSRYHRGIVDTGDGHRHVLAVAGRGAA